VLRRLPYRVPILIAWFVATCPATAQVEPPAGDPDSFVNRQRAWDEQLRAQLDAEATLAQRLSLDYGGWLSNYVFLFDDGLESSRTLRRYDLRLWGRVTASRGAHEWYVRTRAGLLDFNSGDAYDGNDDDIEGPNLERGYYRFDLARLREDGPADGFSNLVLLAGRDFVRLGNGLTLATPLDHVSLTLSAYGFDFRGLAGRTVGSTPDFDLARTAERTSRAFFGSEVRYRHWDRHEPFAYALWQRDHNHESRPSLEQPFEYDSFYAGLGCVGELLPRLIYRTEGVFESGHSHADAGGRDANVIRAWAYDGELEYLLPGRYRPRVSLAYIFASGDRQRDLSPTFSGGASSDPTRAGDNRYDSSFVGFGYRNLGLALAPRYANLHAWRLGASCFPLPDYAPCKDLQLGTEWFLFHKHHREAAISDPTADLPSGYLGWEMDYYANWAITCDLAWTTRVGLFFPGDAFDDRTTRAFVLVGLNWSF